MITEADRILALILIAADGPVDGQAEEKGWTPDMVRHANNVLLSVAGHIQAGLHNQIPDRLVQLRLDRTVQ